MRFNLFRGSKTESAWAEAIGPVYTEEYVSNTGNDPDKLIYIHTREGHRVFPMPQFEIDPNTADIIGLRPEALFKIWKETLRPAIDDSSVDEYMAATFLFSGSLETGPSYAEVLAKNSHDDTVVHAVASCAVQFVDLMRQ